MTQTSLFPRTEVSRPPSVDHRRETVEFVTLRPVAFAISKFYNVERKNTPNLVWQAPDGTEHLDVGGVQARHITDRIILQVVRQAGADVA